MLEKRLLLSRLYSGEFRLEFGSCRLRGDETSESCLLRLTRPGKPRFQTGQHRMKCSFPEGAGKGYRCCCLRCEERTGQQKRRFDWAPESGASQAPLR